MKEAIVGGVLAGLVGGSIIAGAVFMTQPNSGVVEVYGTVDVGNLSTLAGAANPILVEVQPSVQYGGAIPDGSAAHPYYVYSCENLSGGYAASQNCK